MIFDLGGSESHELIDVMFLGFNGFTEGEVGGSEGLAAVIVGDFRVRAVGLKIEFHEWMKKNDKNK